MRFQLYIIELSIIAPAILPFSLQSNLSILFAIW